MQINWFEKYRENFDLIESALKDCNLWALAPPSQEAMASTIPFAVDTMPLENWLQFIFLPRMRESIDNRQLPPGPAQIFPIVEEAFKGKSEIAPLLDAMRKFDEISHLSHLH